MGRKEEKKEEIRICKSTRRSEGHKGEPCGARAVPGSDYCRFHGGGAVGKKTGKGRPKGCDNGATPGNTNAVKHGAYSSRLLPDEQERYEEIKKRFELELGGTELSASDERLIHQFAAVSAKFDVALEKGAPPDALNTLNRMSLELLRELKATRASKAPQQLVVGSPAQFAGALLARMQERKPEMLEQSRPMLEIMAEVEEADEEALDGFDYDEKHKH